MKHLTLSILLLLASCANIPKTSKAKDLEAKKFLKDPDKAGLYIYRNQGTRVDVAMKIYLNNKLLAHTGYNSFLYIPLDPGKYVLKDDSGASISSIELNLKAGKNTFVWQQLTTSILSYRSKLIQVHEDEGKQGVLETERIKLSKTYQK